MLTATLNRHRWRLLRFLRVMRDLPGSYLARRGARGLLRALVRAGGLRRAYGVLIDYTSLYPRQQARRYARWIEITEASGGEPSVRVVLAVSFRQLDDEQFRFILANVVEHARCVRVFVDVETGGHESLGELRARGVDAHPMAGECQLPGDALGVVFLGRGCCLHPNSLGAITRALAGGADLVYGDSDQIDLEGIRQLPYFKPDFSPDLLFHQDYMSDCVGVSRRIWDGTWRFDDPYASVLRSVEAASRIEHLPAVLSHALPGVRRIPLEPPGCLEQLLQRRYGSCARVEATPSGWRCRFGNAARPHVTVVIPTRDRVDLLAPCVDSLFATNSGSEFDVIVVDNGSRQRETREWLKRTKRDRGNFRTLSADIEFNWSQLNNLALAEATGDVFVFLNNDTVSVTGGWLARIAEYAVREDVGVVGALLLFDDGRIQHAGVVVGYGGRAGHVYSGVHPADVSGTFVSPTVPRNVATVTGACLAVSRNVTEAIGVFNEDYRVVGNDTEFCLRAHLAGLRNVYLPEIVLLHHESQSRGRSDPQSDNDRLERFIAEHLPRDPYYNPNLTLSSLYPSLSAEPRTATFAAPAQAGRNSASRSRSSQK